MNSERVEILVGNTPESAVVFQIAERQRRVLSDYYSNVSIGFDREATISIVHKVGVDVRNCCGIKILYFHFDPYDIRIRSEIVNLDDYLNLFDIVVCLNRKQVFYCDKRGIKNTLIPHGSDFSPYKNLVHSEDDNPVMALVCDYYRGNVKGEKYFFELSERMSGVLDFKVIGKGWRSSGVTSKNVEILNVDSYSELKSHFHSVDIMFIGSRYEAGPASFPDAVNSNKYVIATPVGMVLDNFIEDISGHYLTFDLKKDLSNINKILNRVLNNIPARFNFIYPNWNEQIRGIIEVVDESRNQKNQ
ncbi:hypothetical protein [Bermanella sp. R86510]|uniref:hypothetical protein n=1 Tax=unclassified Bermanella TaxID=2627862 RepID=UPI0037CA7EEE